MEKTVLEPSSIPRRNHADNNTVIVGFSERTENSCCFFHLHQHCKQIGWDVWLSADAFPRLGICFPRQICLCYGSFASAGMDHLLDSDMLNTFLQLQSAFSGTLCVSVYPPCATSSSFSRRNNFKAPQS